MDINNVPVVSNIPLTQKMAIGYRTVTDSNQINIFQEDVINDILDLFNKANDIEKSLIESKDIISIENKYLQLKVQSLESNMAIIIQKYLDLSSGTKIKTINIYPSQCYIDSGTYGAFIDLENNDITMKISSSSSKVSFYDDVFNTTFIPPSLKVSLLPETDNIKVIDNDVTNAFQNNYNTFWTRKIITDSSVTEVTTSMIIVLPEDIVSTRDVNTIIINPYPSDAVDIVSVEYSLYGSWVPVKAFANHVNSVLEEYSDVFGNNYQRPILLDSSSIKLNFKDINANQLRITFRQRNYINGDNNTRIFCMGAKSINILNCKYGKNYSTFCSKVEFPEATGTIVFNGLDVVLNNTDELTTNIVQSEFYYIDNFDVPHKITDSIPFTVPTKKMLIKCKLYKGETTPNINKLKLSYNVV